MRRHKGARKPDRKPGKRRMVEWWLLGPDQPIEPLDAGVVRTCRVRRLPRKVIRRVVRKITIKNTPGH